VDDGIEQAHALAGKIYTLRILDGERSAQDLAAPLWCSASSRCTPTREGPPPVVECRRPGTGR